MRRYIGLASALLDTASDALESIREIVPNDTVELAMAVIEVAKTAAAGAEQLWINGSIGKDERKAAALEYAFAALDAMGVELTDAIRKIVDGAIEAACLLDLPHNT